MKIYLRMSSAAVVIGTLRDTIVIFASQFFRPLVEKLIMVVLMFIDQSREAPRNAVNDSSLIIIKLFISLQQ